MPDQADEELTHASMPILFDAEVETPQLIDELAKSLPGIRATLATFRKSLPLVAHSGIGPVGRSGYYRLPNHYRSISYLLGGESSDGQRGASGVIVFKGTEPLLPDFPAYRDWMLRAPFRSSALTLGLHFPMEIKLPPGAMWIEECKAEQKISSRIQSDYLKRYGRLARLPLPLFTFKATQQQDACYEQVVRTRLPEDAVRKVEPKLRDGLGVEAYYYPELPVRVADLFVGNVREAFKQALHSGQVTLTIDAWCGLLSELLCLGYSPFTPWHRGMGACVDRGNVCIDGGFNDLLTITEFSSIPDDAALRGCAQGSVKTLAESVLALAAASIGMTSAPAIESDIGALAFEYVARRVGAGVLAEARNGQRVDARLLRYFDEPTIAELLERMAASQISRRAPTQYVFSGRDGSIERSLSSSGSCGA